MKQVFTLFLISIAASSYAQQWQPELSFGYVYASPQDGMGTVIRQGHGLNLGFYGITPGKRWAIGVEFNAVFYGSQEERKQFSFADGTTADMDVTVTNYFTQFMIGSRYYLPSPTFIQPYLAAKAGYSPFATRLSIFDPEDDDHCEPVDSDVLSRSGSLVGAFGVGVQFDLSRVFKSWATGRYFIEGSATYTYGGAVDYMNVDAPAAAAGLRRDLNGEFVDTRTQVVHEHHVGYLYRDHIELIDFRLLFSIRL